MVNPLELALQQVMQGTAPQGGGLGGGSFSPYQGLYGAPQANPMLEQIMQALQQGGLGTLIAQPGTSLDIQPRVPEQLQTRQPRDPLTRFQSFFDKARLGSSFLDRGGEGSAGGGMGGSAGGGGTGPGGAGAGSGGRG